MVSDVLENNSTEFDEEKATVLMNEKMIDSVARTIFKCRTKARKCEITVESDLYHPRRNAKLSNGIR